MENFQNIENALGNVPGLFFLWLDGIALANSLAQAPEESLVMLDHRCILVSASNPEKIQPPQLQIQFCVAGNPKFRFFASKT